MSATIAARAHSGSTLSAPARRRPTPARRKAPWLSRLARTIARRPGRALLILIFAGIAGTILLNALMFQTVRHPAPMAAAPPAMSQTPRVIERRAETPAVAPLAASAGTPASAPVPPSRPNDLSSVSRETQIRPPAAVTSVARTAPAPVAPAPAPRAAAPRDPIADLINGGDFRPPADIRGGAKAASMRRPGEN